MNPSTRLNAASGSLTQGGNLIVGNDRWSLGERGREISYGGG